MNLSGGAAAFRGLADRIESSLALEACDAGARDFLAVLRTVTPKRSGALADSETVTGPAGSGTYAIALVGPHIVYDRFRNDGGTITSHGPWSLSDGVSYFGRSVTQAGSHYMERGEAAGAGVVAAAVAQVAARFITL